MPHKYRYTIKFKIWYFKYIDPALILHFEITEINFKKVLTHLDPCVILLKPHITGCTIIVPKSALSRAVPLNSET